MGRTQCQRCGLHLDRVASPVVGDVIPELPPDPPPEPVRRPGLTAKSFAKVLDAARSRLSKR